MCFSCSKIKSHPCFLRRTASPSSSNADGPPPVSFSKPNGSALPPSGEHHDEEEEEERFCSSSYSFFRNKWPPVPSLRKRVPLHLQMRMGLLLLPFQNKTTEPRFDTFRIRRRAFATAAIRHRWRTQKNGEHVCCEDALAKHYSPDTLEWKRSWWKTHNNGRTAAQRKYIHSIDEINLRFSHHSGS